MSDTFTARHDDIPSTNQMQGWTDQAKSMDRDEFRYL